MFKLLILGMVLSFQAKAGPEWISNVPKEDPAYKYYVGKSSANSDSEAFLNALEDVKLQIIMENYGLMAQVNISSQEDLEQVGVSKKMKETSSQILIKGLKVEGRYNEDTQYWFLFSCNKKLLEIEKNRQNKMPLPNLSDKKEAEPIKTEAPKPEEDDYYIQVQRANEEEKEKQQQKSEKIKNLLLKSDPGSA